MPIILSLLACLSFGTSLYYQNKPYPKAHPFNESKDNQYSYIDVEVMSEVFATDHKDDYYFVYDDKNIYIALIEDLEPLSEVYDYSFNQSSRLKSVRIYGMCKTIPDDLKEIASQQLKEWYPEDVTVGDYYLNLKTTPYNYLIQPLQMVSIALVILAIIFQLKH